MGILLSFDTKLPADTVECLFVEGAQTTTLAIGTYLYNEHERTRSGRLEFIEYNNQANLMYGE